MKNKLVAFIVLIFFLFPFVVRAGIFQSEAQFSDWVTSYYLHPAPEKISEAIQYFSNSPAYKTDTTMPMIAFFAALFRSDRVLAENVFNQISSSGSENSKIMLLNILGFNHDEKSRALLQKAKKDWTDEGVQNVVNKQLELSAVDLSSILIDSPLTLDMLWSTFYATGSSWPVKKIISVMHFKTDGKGMDQAIGAAAEWTLGTNAQKYERVCQICEAEVKGTTGKTKDLLNNIVHSCHKK